jgi:hypothetical protein
MSAAMLVAGSAQRLKALQRANEVRAARAALKRQIAAGEFSAAEAILSGGAEIARMTIIELLMSQRSWGHARCRRLLRTIPLAENKTIGSMTDRQRCLLAASLAPVPHERDQTSFDVTPSVHVGAAARRGSRGAYAARSSTPKTSTAGVLECISAVRCEATVTPVVGNERGRANCPAAQEAQ